MFHAFKTQFSLVSFSALLALAAGCDRHLDATVEPKPNEARAGLDAAHEAYLDSDWTVLGERVRDVLLDPNATDLVKQNAYELLDKAYEYNGGRIPTAWHLDAGIEKLTIGFIHGMGPDGPHDRVFVKGRMRDASHVAEVTVRRLPDETILDKSSNKGKYEIKHDLADFEDFNLDVHVPALPADGVYTVHVELDDQKTLDGWFIARSLASTAVPEMRSPLASASFTDEHPLLSWAPFKSPQYLPFEKRVINVWESGTDRNGHSQSWGLWTDVPDELGDVHIGDPTGSRYGSSKSDLEPGDYSVMVDAVEVRTFGPIELARTSRSVEPFHVVQ